VEGFAWLYAGALLAPFIALLFEAAASEAGALPGTMRQWGALAYLGLVPSGLGFFLWNRGVSRVPASVAAVMNNAKVPLGVVLAWALFSEQIDLVRIGASLALMGVALALTRVRRLA
jgi:drug/metabolite transporter (DMT)-like permease